MPYSLQRYALKSDARMQGQQMLANPQYHMHGPVQDVRKCCWVEDYKRQVDSSCVLLLSWHHCTKSLHCMALSPILHRSNWRLDICAACFTPLLSLFESAKTFGTFTVLCKSLDISCCKFRLAACWPCMLCDWCWYWFYVLATRLLATVSSITAMPYSGPAMTGRC